VTDGGELKANNKSYYKMTVNKFMTTYVHFPSSKFAVEAQSEETMKKILGKEEGKISIPDDLQELAKEVAGATEWSAQKLDGGAGSGAKAKGMASSSKVSSDSVEAEFIASFANSDEASKGYDEGKKKLDEGKKKGEEGINAAKLNDDQKRAAKDALNSISINKSGSKVTISFSLKTKPFEGADMNGNPLGGLIPFGF
jgi:hypothetical protein